MNAVFPILKQDGKPYHTLNEFKRLFEETKSGRYIMSQGHGWHGGMHITDKQAPWCRHLSPVQAMMDGRVVVYRMNENYLESQYETPTQSTVPLKFSNNFVLIEHSIDNPDQEDKQATSFTFYTLYMHLAPISDMKETEAYSVNRGKGINGHQFGFSGNSEPSKSVKDKVISLAKDTVIEHVYAKDPVKHDGYYYSLFQIMNVPDQSQQSTVGQLVWVAIGRQSATDRLNDTTYFRPAQQTIPQWMKHDDFCSDGSVVLMPYDGEDYLKVKAGDALGYLGLHEFSQTMQPAIKQEYQVHIECFSIDEPPTFFLKMLSPADDTPENYFKIIDGTNDQALCSGEISIENKFFKTIAEYVSQQSLLPEKFKKADSLRAYLEPNRERFETLIVKHQNEWHVDNTQGLCETSHAQSQKAMDEYNEAHFEPGTYYDSKWRQEIFLPSHERFIQHETDRLEQYAWMRDFGEPLCFTPELWHLWPLAYLKIFTILKSDQLRGSHALNESAEKKAVSYSKGARDKKGAKDKAVELIQKALLAFEYDLSVDGDFGDKTEQVIKRFQQEYQPSHQYHDDYQMPKDGIVDGNTLLAIDEALLEEWKTPLKVNVIYKHTLAAEKRVVSDKSIKLIQSVFEKAGVKTAVITSTFRTPYEQASIMYRNAKIDLKGQKKMYGPVGDKVLIVYEKNKSKSSNEVINLMENKINSLADEGEYVSNHIVTLEKYNKNNIIDIGVNSVLIKNGNDKDIIEKITRGFDLLEQNNSEVNFLDETQKSNKCWHLEVKQ